jgi:hypothetical protein
MNKFSFAIIAALSAATAVSSASAREVGDRDIFPRFEARQESNFERNAREFKPAYERAERERTREQMRDKTHDNRIPVDKNTSVGANGSGVNVIRTY